MNKLPRPRLSLICLAASLGLLMWFPGCITPEKPLSKQESETLFLTKVKPVLEYYCIECHSSQSKGKYGGFILENGHSAMTTGRMAPVIRPGNPDQSLLYIVLRLGHEQVLGMPPSPDKISDEELDGIRKWILAGAQWPSGGEGRLVLPKN